MKTDQIYGIVNEVFAQATGNTNLKAIDTDSLIAMGKVLLSSADAVDNFTNTLVQRIGRTIMVYRDYRNQLRILLRDNFEWGAIVQKVNVDMPEAKEAVDYDLVDGQSVDMYIVNKPVVHQKFFTKNTPYVFFITIQRHHLKEAFLSERGMASFLTSVYGKVRNKLEVTMENLSRLCIANFIANVGPSQTVNLATKYQEATGAATKLTPEQAMFDADFLRYAIGQLNLYSSKMRSMSTLYNKSGTDKFTPYDKQIFLTIADFTTQLQTVVQYSAFNEQYVNKVAAAEVPYWQSATSPFAIDVEIDNGSGVKTEVQIDNIVGAIFDYDALGTYREEEDVLTTPVNARGRYFNTFWHERQMWFNDLDENGILFTLN